MTKKLSAYMGGLGIDARNKLEVEANATVTIGGDGTGNVNIGAVTVFGNRGLEIDSDATNPVIGITGGGPNFIRFFDNTSSTNAVDIVYRTTPNDLLIERSGGQNIAEFGGDDGHAALYFNDAKKLETAEVGVAVTGNVGVSANVGVSGNVQVGTYLAIANTNPAATDALVVNGNIRIQAGSLIFADGTSQSTGSTTSAFPTGDYGLLDASNVSTDSFGEVTGGLTQFDMLTQPSGSVDGQDLGALS